MQKTKNRQNNIKEEQSQRTHTTRFQDCKATIGERMAGLINRTE